MTTVQSIYSLSGGCESVEYFKDERPCSDQWQADTDQGYRGDGDDDGGRGGVSAMEWSFRLRSTTGTLTRSTDSF